MGCHSAEVPSTSYRSAVHLCFSPFFAVLLCVSFRTAFGPQLPRLALHITVRITVAQNPFETTCCSLALKNDSLKSHVLFGKTLIAACVGWHVGAHLL